MSNLSIFDHNVIHAFAGVTDDAAALDEAEAIYLRHVDDGALKAEAIALEWLSLNERIAPMLEAAARPIGGTVPDGLREFIRDRHYHWRFPAGKDGRTPFVKATGAPQ